jgi:hypothetical protein
MKLDKFFEGQSINIEILNHEKTSFTQGGNGAVIYYKIENLTNKKIHILVQDEYVINKKNGQFDKDFYLTGFHIDKTSIQPGAHKVAGAIFLDSTCGELEDSFRTGVTVIDETNGREYKAIFLLRENKWLLVNCEIKESEIILDNKSIIKRLKKSIERLEVFEEKLGIRLDNLSVTTQVRYCDLCVLGEVYSLSGNSLSDSVVIQVNLYNNEGEIVDTNKCYIDNDRFMGYDAFKIEFSQVDTNSISKIRVFPGVRY